MKIILLNAECVKQKKFSSVDIDYDTEFANVEKLVQLEIERKKKVVDSSDRRMSTSSNSSDRPQDVSETMINNISNESEDEVTSATIETARQKGGTLPRILMQEAVSRRLRSRKSVSSTSKIAVTFDALASVASTLIRVSVHDIRATDWSSRRVVRQEAPAAHTTRLSAENLTRNGSALISSARV